MSASFERRDLTWFGDKVWHACFTAMFRLEQGRDAPAVLDELVATLLRLHAVPTCERGRR